MRIRLADHWKTGDNNSNDIFMKKKLQQTKWKTETGKNFLYHQHVNKYVNRVWIKLQTYFTQRLCIKRSKYDHNLHTELTFSCIILIVSLNCFSTSSFFLRRSLFSWICKYRSTLIISKNFSIFDINLNMLIINKSNYKIKLQLHCLLSIFIISKN